MQNTEESFGCGETRIKNSTSRRTQRASAPDQADAERHVLRGLSFHGLVEDKLAGHRRAAIPGEDRLVVDLNDAKVDAGCSSRSCGAGANAAMAPGRRRVGAVRPRAGRGIPRWPRGLAPRAPAMADQRPSE